MPTQTMLSQHQTMDRTIASRHLRSLQMSPPRARLQRVARGASISIICANDIANTPRIEPLLAALATRLTHQRRSVLQRIKLVWRSTLRAVIDHHCSATTDIMYVGGSLLGCCCWSEPAVDSFGFLHTLLAQEKMFTLYHRRPRSSRESLLDNFQTLLKDLAPLLFDLSVAHASYIHLQVRSSHPSLRRLHTQPSVHHSRAQRQPPMCHQPFQPVPRQDKVTI